MLNKKGFTIAEVLVSFSLISIILASIMSATLFYRDRLKQEEVVSQLNDFKNSITKAVYDDIIYNKIVKVETCVGISNCVNFIDDQGNSHVMKIVEFSGDEVNGSGVYLYYNNIKYLLPDSDLKNEYKRKLEDNTEITVRERVCDFIGGIEIDAYNNKIYKVTASYKHKDIDLQYDFLFVVS